ncbi:tannase/feruloyl esterase family alpha/beta hydrolase [Streptomyces sp. HUAS MG91]|uniref:Tannase/feruloyl esterase family alpha/beta hydrolase n=1 Tax=Streptomyces tabacisoli TaxID=3156398 RepID=A0AAU8IJW9_9ACTN
MKRLLTVLAAAVPLVTAAVYLPTATAESGGSTAAPFRCASDSLALKAPSGAKIESVAAVSKPAGDVEVPPVTPLPGDTVENVPAHCQVTITLGHVGAEDHAKVQVWLPEHGWNGRFQGLGGSAYAAGDYGSGLAAAVKSGYATATTDAGVGSYLDVSWALDGRGEVDRTLLKNFASRSVHEAAVVAKQVIGDVYGRSASYSYFNGCSTGGRQGYAEAQSHPGDYDGILADAPGINWDEFEVATAWPQVVMNEEHSYPSACELTLATQSAVKACDTLDGAADGIIGDPAACHYDPRRLIGTTLECDGKKVTFSAADAAVVRKIWEGPRSTSGQKLWYGPSIGSDLTVLAASDGVSVGSPFPVPSEWISTFVKKQSDYNVATASYSEFQKLFRQSQAEYDKVIGTDDPDLSGFRKSGGKLLTWQGQADQLIPTQGTVDYRERVEKKLGGAQRVDDFYRVFLAPGVNHCAGDGNTGPAPTDALGSLVDWVEHGKAPRTLDAAVTDASGKKVTRDLCLYPRVPQYKGHGDVADASSFRCVAPRH